MTARNPSIFRPSHLVWACGLAALVAATGVETGAVAQAAKPPVGTSTQGTTSQGTAAQTAGGRGANGQAGAPGQPSGPGATGQRPDRRLWWKDEAIKKEIGLRDDQAKRIDDYFTRRAAFIEPLNREIDKQRAELDRLMNDRTTDQRTVERAIELQTGLMEVPRVKVNESWNVMLYRMRRTLEPEQWKKLQAIFDRDRTGRGGGH